MEDTAVKILNKTIIISLFQCSSIHLAKFKILIKNNVMIEKKIHI
jgi:hypothetical protein